eukprot:c23735_g1_i1.p1 GENE.c23735_g1_i1~~c23735_g1_i1.p1  ORF type:complete len:225 (+),score=25.52 c23735_g1_i1:40-714(+)
MCLLCSNEEEYRQKNPRGNNPNGFKTSLCDAPCKNPGCCIIAFCCPPCAVYTMRQRALKGDMSRYICCQGYVGGCCCCKPGQMGERSCPEFCLCLEVCCCLGLSMSATRSLVMDERQIHPDPCDYRLMCFSNCLQLVSCICMILAIFNDGFRGLADLTRKLADLVFHIILACMVAQVDLELRDDPQYNQAGTVVVQTMPQNPNPAYAKGQYGGAFSPDGTDMTR